MQSIIVIFLSFFFYVAVSLLAIYKVLFGSKTLNLIRCIDKCQVSCYVIVYVLATVPIRRDIIVSIYWYFIIMFITYIISHFFYENCQKCIYRLLFLDD